MGYKLVQERKLNTKLMRGPSIGPARSRWITCRNLIASRRDLDSWKGDAAAGRPHLKVQDDERVRFFCRTRSQFFASTRSSSYGPGESQLSLTRDNLDIAG